MIVVGQVCLLAAFVSIGYAAFATLVGVHDRRREWLRTGMASAIVGVSSLTAMIGILSWALWTRDFRFEYVAQYTNRLLPWHYALSAMWVGQAGSLLLWTWMLGLLSLAFRRWHRHRQRALLDTAFGILMSLCAFLTATMLFAADPMETNIAPGSDGAGLSPLLHHPAMLIHPPVVFFGYATWAVPCSLAIAVLVVGRRHPGGREKGSDPNSLQRPSGASHDWGLTPFCREGEADWLRMARPWALLAWTVLGGGILLGAYWSYEELGWGGYWAWDPVENGSLIPWLIGTAFIHALMVWQYCGMLKKTCITLAIATFGLCNFATFLTRSGIFSSLHAFSQSPIGWLFLGLMFVLAGVGVWTIASNRMRLVAEQPLTSVWTREAFIMVSIVSLLLMAAVTVTGTLAVALSDAILGRRIVVGPEFYNSALIPIGLVLMVTVSLAPLLRWRTPPSAEERKAFQVAAGVAVIPALIVALTVTAHPLALAIAWLAPLAAITHLFPAVLQSWRRDASRPLRGLYHACIVNRRTYSGFVIHLGFVCVVVGICGSSLGSRRHQQVMKPGDVITWAGRTVHYRGLITRQLADKHVVEADLQVSRGGGEPIRLLPAQHLHQLQNQWTTEVAIDSSWSGDFYTILHNGEGEGAVRLTLVSNPMMWCIWFGGWVIVAATSIRLWPARVRARHRARSPVSLRPAAARRRKRSKVAVVHR